MKVRTCRRRLLILYICILITSIVILLSYTPHDDWPKEHIDLSSNMSPAEKLSRSDQLLLLPVTLARLVSFKQHAKTHSNYEILNRTKILDKLENIRTPRFKKEKCLTEFGLNTCISEALPLKRRLHVKRTYRCSTKKYPKHLPLVSIIIPLVNEHWHTTLRMLYGLAQTTQRELLQEIILVHGEYSTMFANRVRENCWHHVENLTMKVVSCAEGSTATYKLEGALAAVGEVLVFLSPRMEFVSDWLPPLLEPLVLDHRKVTTPHVDIIDSATFEHIPVPVHRRTVFDWKLRIKHFPIDPETENMHIPFETPVLSSELFAIRKGFYWELGGHDGTLTEIHATTLDLSFKIWLCGGSISAVSCSHCAYINPNMYRQKRSTQQLLDYRHVSARWMDEYQHLVYAKKSSFHKLPPGNITGHQDQKDEMACRPFRWYLEKVAYEVLKEFPIMRKPLASGLLKNLPCDRCLTVHYTSPEMGECKSNDENKLLTLERNGDLLVKLPERRSLWLAINKPEQPIAYVESIVSVSVESKSGYYAYEWRYNLETEQLMIYPYKWCIDVQEDCTQIFLVMCDRKSSRQRWQFSKIDKEAVLRHYDYGDNGDV